jgi:16S rRNA (cytosine1402-N4)-methyltransferase
MSKYHIPVMLNEVLDNLEIKLGEWYVDCNLGGGGHTAGILERSGRVIGIDLDPDAIAEVRKNHGETENLVLYQGNFSEINKAVGDRKIAGVLFDLGVSTHQLEEAERGFSFNQEAVLDMRMDKTANQATAADLVNGLHEKELAELFWKLGEENWAKPIAKRIVQERAKQKIETTNQLAQIVLSVRHRGKNDRTHPATRIFQALRIAVNDELNNLKEALPKAFQVLEPGGRLVVISFHSLEDRIVKDFFREMSDNGQGVLISKKPLEPTENEVDKNPRARSAKLRILEKIV